MISLLSKWLIKDCKNINDPKVRRIYGKLCSIVGILLNIFLFVGKYLAGVLSGSIAILADAFNNLTDAGSSLITLVGFHFAGKKPDPRHPFGHGRIEYIAGLAVAVIILLIGWELARTSIGKILHPEEMTFSLLSMGILVVSILIKLYMFFYNRSIGKKINSAAMRATGLDSLTDAIATSVVLLSMVVMQIFSINIDGWCGVLVALFILYAGFQAARDTLDPLLGQAPDPELISNIESIVMRWDVIHGIHDLVVHDYGPGRCMVSLHGEVDGTQDIYVLHDAVDRIEEEIREKLGCEAVIHMDPIAVGDEKTMVLRDEVAQLLRTLHADISIHDFRMVDGPTHTNVIFDAVLPFTAKMRESEAEAQIKAMVQQTWPERRAVVRIDRPYTDTTAR